jgi:hypothetical protein
LNWNVAYRQDADHVVQPHAAQREHVLVPRRQPQPHLHRIDPHANQLKADAANDGQHRLQCGNRIIGFDAETVVFLCGIHGTRIAGEPENRLPELL